MLEIGNHQELVELARHGKEKWARENARMLLEAIQDYNKKKSKEAKTSAREQKRIIRLHRRLYNRYLKRKFLKRSKLLLKELAMKAEAAKREREAIEAREKRAERECRFFEGAIRGVEKYI